MFAQSRRHSTGLGWILSAFKHSIDLTLTNYACSTRCLVILSALMIAWPCDAETPTLESLLQRGQSRMDRSDNVGAVLDFSAVIEQDPKNAKAYYLRGRAKSNLKFSTYAKPDYDWAIELDPNFVEARRYRGSLMTYKSVGNLDDSIDDLSIAIKAGLDVKDAYAERGQSRSNFGDLLGALDDTNMALQSGADYVYFQRSQINRALGDNHEALDDLNKDIASLDSFAPSYLDRGLTQLLLGDDKSAEHDFEKYLTLQPGAENAVAKNKELAKILLSEPQPESADDFVKRGELLLTKDYKSECIFDCGRALALEPDSIKAYVLRARALYLIKYYSSSVSDLTRAIELDPNNPEFYYLRARDYWQVPDSDAGLADCDRALELDPRDWNAMNIKGLIYLSRQEDETASKWFAKSIEINSADSTLRRNLGEALGKSANFPAAIASLTKAIERDASINMPFILRAQNHGALGDVTSAMNDLKKATEMATWDQYPWQVRAIVGLQNGDLNMAMESVDKSLELSEHDGESYRIRALIKESQGDQAAALADADNAVMWDSGTADHYFVRGLLRQRFGQTKTAARDFAIAINKQPSLKDKIATMQAVVATNSVAQLLYPKPQTKTGGTESNPVVMLKPAVASIPKPAQKIFDNAVALYEQGKYEESAKELRRAILVFPRFGEAYLFRGLIHLRNGEQADADRAFAECLRIRPDLKPRLDEEREKINQVK